jgi:hypothetical protein
MIVIIPDTNIFYDSPSLASETWRSLKQHSKDWGVQILVPDVVLMETANLVRRKWKSEQQKFGSIQVGEFKLDKDLQAIVDKIQQRIDGYEDELKGHLDDVGADTIPVPLVSHLEIAGRASRRIAPYQGGEKDGYRDTLIWLTVMHAAAERPEDDVYFVSHNTQDFGPKPPDWTGKNIGKRTDCPILFHSHLEQELRERGLDDRIKYVASLEVLEQHLAAMHAPISDADLAALSSSIDFVAMNAKLEILVTGSKVTPSEAALNPAVTEAFVNHVKIHEAPWEFMDAAKRGQGRWATNYTVDVQAEMITFTGAGATAVVTKTLRISGYVTLMDSGELELLEITSRTSLPDDPDRALWESLPADYLSALAAMQHAQLQYQVPDSTFDALQKFAESARFQVPDSTFDALQKFAESARFQVPDSTFDALQKFAESARFQVPQGMLDAMKTARVGTPTEDLDQSEQSEDPDGESEVDTSLPPQEEDGEAPDGERGK